MALTANHNETLFGVGDRVKVSQSYKQGDKLRKSVFEGMVIGVRGSGAGKSFIVRRIGVQQVGIEKIFSLQSPTLNSVEVIKKGMRGVRRSKLYYTRDKSQKEIDLIYTRSVNRERAKKDTKNKNKKKTPKRKTNAPKKKV